MQRTIKFRAWDAYKGKMTYDFIIHSSGIWFDKYTTCENTYHCGAQEYGLQRHSSIPNGLVMQFTGLHDKNGKEIYEGDVVKTFWQHDGMTNYDYERVGVIVWVQALCQFMLQTDNDYWPLSSFEREQILEEEGFEVIGNIYESPEYTKSV